MSKIDIDKFIVSLIQQYCKNRNLDRNIYRCWIDMCLEEQGLEVKNNEIVKIKKDPCFKVGDYIIHNSDSNPFVITKISGETCEIVSCKDNYDYNLPIQYLENNFHLLTNKTSNWKPSEEQLAWIRDELKMAEEIDAYHRNTNHYSNSDVIRSIYKEMLKLKEDNKC